MRSVERVAVVMEVGVWVVGAGGVEGVTDSRDPAGEKPEPSKCLLMFHGKGADFIGALMGDMSLIGSAG